MMNRRAFLRSLMGAAVALPAAAAAPSLWPPWWKDPLYNGTCSNAVSPGAALNIESLREALAMFEAMDGGPGWQPIIRPRLLYVSPAGVEHFRRLHRL